jgi:siroheme synthase
MENVEKKYPIAIVGTGPGDPDLLTVKAKRLIEEADMVYYDCLPATHVLSVNASPDKIVFINKHPEAGEKQEDILEYVRQSYLEGK